MNILFMGTPEFAAVILDSLIKTHTVSAVVTQPDRPRGRGHAMQYPPVKVLALEHGIPVLQPERIKSKDFVPILSAYNADVFVVAAYGQILPTRILAVPPLGCINVHASLLPQYRGASPMQHTLMNGDTVTGVSIQYMAKGIDTGDIILQRALPVDPFDRFGTLHDKMAALSCTCIAEALLLMASGHPPRTPQDPAQATYAPLIAKEDGLINWNAPTACIVNLTRALDPWPGTYTFMDGQVLKIWDCKPVEPAQPAEPTESAEPGVVGIETAKPGTVLAVTARGIAVKTGDGTLWVTELQTGGSKRMKTLDYLRGRTIAPGTVLG